MEAASVQIKEIQAEGESPQKTQMLTHLMGIKGDCYLDMRRYIEAEQCFDQMYQELKCAVGLTNRGYARWIQGRLSEAKDDYTRALSLDLSDEDREIALRQIVSICVEMSDTGEAEAFLHCVREVGGDSDAIAELEKKS